MSRCYKQNSWSNELGVGQSLTGENMSVEAEGIVVICHQETIGEDTADREDFSTCCSELQSVWISDSAVVTCSYDL
jgi:hypothetical protein